MAFTKSKVVSRDAFECMLISTDTASADHLSDQMTENAYYASQNFTPLLKVISQAS